ncbi:MAG TPA: TAT-variant-translocated molybdopterin oxidoreductase [Thermoanaerobaculia bacterium]
MTEKNQHLDLAAFRARLGETTGPKYWRALEELEQDPSFEEVLRREFPREAAHLDNGGVDRRDFLRLMGASLAMGGVAACAPPTETIVPYVQAPEQVVPGRPLFYATAMENDGAALGLLVESHMGRPTKVEGNPEHPASLGATNHWAQASVLSLYDPDRSASVRNVGEVSTWNAFASALQARIAPLRARGGEGLRILTGTMTSPTLGDQMRALRVRYPRAIWHTWEPDGRAGAREGARAAFGQPLNTIYRFREADVVLSLGSDFTFRGGASVRQSRDFMDRRRVRAGRAQMNRLYVAETMPTATGSIADHRVAVTPSQLEALARAIAAQLGVVGAAGAGEHAAWAAAVAKDLRAHAGRSIVIAGEEQPAQIHALAHAMNAALGNAGRTVLYTAPIEINPVNQSASIRALAADMRAGRVDTLVIIGENPAFTAPADLGFAEAMEKVPFRVHAGTYYDETSALAHWHVPLAHYLESWSDARAFDGTVSIVQPLIQPLYGGRTAHEIVAAMSEDVRTGYDIVRDYWRANGGAADFETFWNRARHDGVLPNTALPAAAAAAGAVPPPATRPAGGGLEVVLRPDPMIHDGRWANNGWLQELPRPVTKLTWDNVAHVSPATANANGWTNGDVIAIRAAGRTVEAPVWIVPGHADGAITLDYGYGAVRSGKVAKGTGFNVYPLRTVVAGDVLYDGAAEKTGRKVRIATTQAHHALSSDFKEGGGDRREIIRAGTIAQFAADPTLGAHDTTEGPNLYPKWEYPNYAWGMVIDTNVCTGCGVCNIACQAENNIAVVGKEQVLVGREMHWIRVDHYYKGDPSDGDLEQYNMPVPCMHCENAPCEPVCPVEATSHSDEGLNDMTYNRCVGTRYCANNCPYKVRRFNFLAYSDFETENYKAMRNPDVTTRSRGVMEKCTYCVQRINAARIQSENEGRPIRDGEIVPACAQACPTEAIVFGNINDENSEVAKLRAQPLNYGLLAELNTVPRTTYLGALKNPNPELAPALPAAATEHHGGEQ